MCLFPFHILNHNSTLASEEDREVEYQHQGPTHRFLVYMSQRPNSLIVVVAFAVAAVAGMRLDCMEQGHWYSEVEGS